MKLPEVCVQKKEPHKRTSWREKGQSKSLKQNCDQHHPSSSIIKNNQKNKSNTHTNRKRPSSHITLLNVILTSYTTTTTIMSHSSRRIHDLQQVFVRQSVILRDNLHQFDQRLLSGDDWPSMLGRLNAAAVRSLLI